MDTEHSVQLIFAYPYFLILFLEHENNFFSDVNLPRLKTLNSQKQRSAYLSQRMNMIISCPIFAEGIYIDRLTWILDAE